ncbi:hypothetical protein EVAR_40429_1 [Eumeta japonica]|uniref:Uncharacterized protein n=1 Tax=Eumeta variegata TaxID=151549 RepID=A0A4C1SE02_EUMVA|nr:hypothetical protein EVAR_40429_1 [Eumeta japonica]
MAIILVAQMSLGFVVANEGSKTMSILCDKVVEIQNIAKYEFDVALAREGGVRVWYACAPATGVRASCQRSVHKLYYILDPCECGAECRRAQSAVVAPAGRFALETARLVDLLDRLTCD